MFIDMKESTKHAEQLGHVKFTRLIQECFRDFGWIAEKWGVDIYQADLLISKDLFEVLDENPDFKMEIIQDVALKGKAKRVGIFSVKHVGME